MTFRATIERLGHHGDGIAAGPVYVPGSLPGEIVEGTLTGDRLSSVKILTPSPDRVRPPCSHFKACGGCSLQHASDSFMTRWKAGVVMTALAAQGLAAQIIGVATSAPRSRRRAVLSGRRTKKGTIVGLHGRASDTIIEIPNCQLLHPALVEVIPALHALTAVGASRKAELSFAITRSNAGVDVAVTGGRPLTGALRAGLAALADRHGLARLSWEDELVGEWRPPTQTFGAATVTPPAGAFLQATEEGQAAMQAAVARAVGAAKNIVDLFAGCGTFALPLARHATVHAVEHDGAMLQALDQGWRQARGLKLLSCETRDLFARPLLTGELDRFQAAVIDPPRAGAQAQFGELARSAIANIAAVSCNPVTFARDARTLCDAGFQIDWIEVVDQFRWSPHVELVAAISRNGRDRAAKAICI